MPTAIDTATTSRVRRVTVSRVGQATFFSSAQLSTRYRRMPVSTIGTFFLLRRGGRQGVRRGGRGDRTRTCNRWFWRPVLYQLSYTPPDVNRLLGLPVQLMLPAARAELVQLQAPRVIPLVLPRAVRAFLADGARQGYHGSVLGLGHGSGSSLFATGSGHAEIGPGNRGNAWNCTPERG